MIRKKSRGLPGSWVEPGSAEIPGHLRRQPSPSLCTSSNPHPLCTCAHGRTRVRANRQLADSSCPCTTCRGWQANPLPVLFWLYTYSLLGTRKCSCSFLFAMPLVLQSLGSKSEEENAPVLYTGSDASLALHPALLGLRARPLPAWLLSLLSHPERILLWKFRPRFLTLNEPSLFPWSPSLCSFPFCFRYNTPSL